MTSAVPPERVVAVVTAPDQLAQAYAVRHEVFVVEQGVPVELERDERDPGADHVLATVGSRPMGAGRLVIEAAGFEGIDEDLGPVGHLGRLAVLAEGRGAGLGAAMVEVIEEQAAVRGLGCVYLGAQTHAVPFYERLGYAAFGDTFDDAGLPHRHMWRRLAPTATMIKDESSFHVRPDNDSPLINSDDDEASLINRA